MLINRRQFLGLTSAGALVATCYPQALLGQSLPNQPRQTTPTILSGMRALPEQKNRLLGYPINLATLSGEFFAWREKLLSVGLNQFAFNNVGNPYEHSHIPFNSHQFEKALIDRFGTVYGFSQDNVWGFLTNSGTDSNMHGMYMGRTLLKSQTGVMPKVYFTREAHYSMQILRDVLNLEWVEVGTHHDGSMDVDDLEKQLTANADYPALVVATIGTTFKGAIDSIDGIQSKLRGRAAYLHLDAALFGGYLPHTPYAADLLYEITDQATGGKVKRYDSIAVSCHKFFGFPSPAGLFITDQRNFEAFQVQFGQIHDPEYILQVPGTITCSRDAVKPAEFYFFSTESAFQKQTEDAKAMLDNTAYLFKEMMNHYKHLSPVRTSERSNLVYFRKPSDAVVDRYSLAVMGLEIDRRRTPYAHVVVMPHVGREVLDQFLADLASKEG